MPRAAKGKTKNKSGGIDKRNNNFDICTSFKKMELKLNTEGVELFLF